MNPWKVILATLVIFMAGLGTGVVLDQQLRILPSRPVASGTLLQHLELMGRMNRQLALTPAQRESLEQIFRESRQRIRQLRETVEPKIKEETQQVRERIRGVLTPEQVRKYDKLMEQSPRLRGPEGARKGWRARDGGSDGSTANPGPPGPSPQRSPPER